MEYREKIRNDFRFKEVEFINKYKIKIYIIRGELIMEKLVAEITLETREPIEEIDTFIWCGCGGEITVINGDGQEIYLHWDSEDVDTGQTDGRFGFTSELSDFNAEFFQDNDLKLTVKELTSLQLIEVNAWYEEDGENERYDLSAPLDVIEFTIWDLNTREWNTFSQENLNTLNKQNDKYWLDRAKSKEE